MTLSTTVIDTANLRLRPFERTDFEQLASYYLLPDAQRYLDWKARDHVDVHAALDAMCKEVALKRPGDTLSFAIERKSDAALVGQISLRWQDATAAQGEVRLVVNPQFRGRGYGKEALKRLIGHGFEELKLHRIFARCDGRTPAAARLLKGLGMRLEAHYREHALFQGEWDEELHFAMLDREWQRSPRISEFRVHRQVA